MTVVLKEIKQSDGDMYWDMKDHYSKPLGFVGRNICYEVRGLDGRRYGSIVGGSATKHLPGREEFLARHGLPVTLNRIVNNVFFHTDRIQGRYPSRNFLPAVLAHFRTTIEDRWRNIYGDDVFAFESLVELPRSGEVYKRDGWEEVGLTKGYTCKRTAGIGTDSWSGKRVWDTENLRPKRVFMRLVDL